MAMNSTERGAANMEYVRRLLKDKRPEFAAALELAVARVERECGSAEIVADCAQYVASHLIAVR